MPPPTNTTQRLQRCRHGAWAPSALPPHQIPEQIVARSSRVVANAVLGGKPVVFACILCHRRPPVRIPSLAGRRRCRGCVRLDHRAGLVRNPIFARQRDVPVFDVRGGRLGHPTLRPHERVLCAVCTGLTWFLNCTVRALETPTRCSSRLPYRLISVRLPPWPDPAWRKAMACCVPEPGPLLTTQRLRRPHGSIWTRRSRTGRR